MNSKQLEQILKSPVTKTAKGCFISIEELEQIKTILEAWEEMKKYIIINEGYNVYFDSTYEYIELQNGCIDESNSEEEGVSIISIKKALEVEDANM